MDCARQDAAGYANSGIDESLAWLSQHGDELADCLLYLHRHLPKLFLSLELDRVRVPTITVTQGDKIWRGSLLLYLIESGLLKSLAGYVSKNLWRKKSYAKKICAHDLADFFRDNLGRPHLNEVGQILREKFPNSRREGENGENDLVEWVKKLLKR
jgi:hypothetical protein